jgi:hypothetical protein
MAIIKVPKTPASAFNKDRRASSLLKAQVEHLEAASEIHPRSPAGKKRKRRPMTEGQAAAYIESLTRALHPQGAKPAGSNVPRSRPKKHR